MRPSVQGVDPPVCCVLDAAVTCARDSSCGFPGGPLVLLRGGGGGGRHPGSRLTLVNMEERIADAELVPTCCHIFLCRSGVHQTGSLCPPPL